MIKPGFSSQLTPELLEEIREDIVNPKGVTTSHWDFSLFLLVELTVEQKRWGRGVNSVEATIVIGKSATGETLMTQLGNVASLRLQVMEN